MMGYFASSYCVLFGLLLTLAVVEVSSLLWKLKPGQSNGFNTGQTFGRYGGGYGGYGHMRGHRGDWGNNGGGWGHNGNNGWNEQSWGNRGNNKGWNEQSWGNRGNNKGWNDQSWGNSGNNKGSNARECYDSRQCINGECCRLRGYGRGQCELAGYGSRYGCMDTRPNKWWPERPVYPQNQKGGGHPPINTGRAGFCPPQAHWQGPSVYCRQDQDCPRIQKCCPVRGKQICMEPIFPSPQ